MQFYGNGRMVLTGRLGRPFCQRKWDSRKLIAAAMVSVSICTNITNVKL